jgi:hypothetical protein
MNDFYDQNDLSENGLRRREEILRSAVRAARHRRLRRQLVHAGLFSGMAITFLFVTAPLWWPAPAPKVIVGQPGTPLSPAHPVVVHPTAPEIVVTHIQTDPTLLQRLSVPPQKPTWKILSDDELLRELADAGKPAGLEYANDGQVVVLYRDQGIGAR